MAEAYLHSAPRWVLVAALPQPGTYTIETQRGLEQCALSLYLDLDAGRVKGIGSYARIWGVPRSTLHRAIPAITLIVWAWASSHGRQPERPVAARYLELILPKWGQAHAPSADREHEDDAEASSRDAAGREWDSGGTVVGRKGARTPPDCDAAGRDWDTGGTVVGRHTNTSSTSSHPKDEGVGRARDSETDAPDPIPYAEIVADLNARTDSRYKPGGRETRKLIHARWAEGHRLEDFRRVHAVKAAEWKGTERARYLRPQTLYGTKFEAYLNQPDPPSRKQGRAPGGDVSDARNDPQGTFQQFYDA